MAIKIKEHKITNDEMNKIFNFILNSRIKFNRLNIREEDIRILMPEWVIFVIQSEISYLTFFSPCSVKKLLEETMYGITVYPHYKNEIVVYSPKFYYSEEKYQSQIYQIA